MVHTHTGAMATVRVRSKNFLKAILSPLLCGFQDQTGCQACTTSALLTVTSLGPKYYRKNIQIKMSLSSKKLFAIDSPAGKQKISFPHELSLSISVQVKEQLANTKQTPCFFVVVLFYSY